MLGTIMDDSKNNTPWAAIDHVRPKCDDDSQSDRRQMVRADLLGKHTHTTTNGASINIWRRDCTYIARGYYEGRAYGHSLGREVATAEAELCRLRTDIENGTYVRPSEARRRPLQNKPPARLSLRSLINEYLVSVRRRQGRKTAATYEDRLAPLIEFTEVPDRQRR